MTKRIFSPYRICPIGAHIDHQGGTVLGRTIRVGTTLEYTALDAPEIQLVSEQFGEARFGIGDEIDKSHWARYAQAATHVLPGLKRGMRARVSGQLIGAGLSSSASVGLAYLKALADTNDLVFTDNEMAQLDYELENGQLGLQNGMLDPLTIMHGKKDALLYMETLTSTVTPIFDPPACEAAWIVAYSGVSRELTKSGFNVRVAECHEAASSLKAGAWKLADIPRELFEEKKMELPGHLRRRAEHFFSEVGRVQQGRQAWADCDLAGFGTLMNQSCKSSIEAYESGSETLIQLHEIASSTAGVHGSRFSGGGYGGCVVALADRKMAESAAERISEKFCALHPELPARVFVAETGDGLR